MPLQIIRQDITKMHVDAIVNTTNEEMVGYSGVDLAVHNGAGPRLDAACKKLAPLGLGKAKITRGYKLPAKFVIHTPGPVWHGGKKNEPELLASCYRSCLTLAVENGCKTVDFPSISTGVYHFPLDKASKIAIGTIAEFLKSHPEIEQVRMVCFDAGTKAHYDKAIAELEA